MAGNFEQHLNAAKQEVQEIAADKKVDKADKAYIQKLDAHMKALEEYKNNEEYQKFKLDLKNLTDSMLKDWFNVNNKDDYNNFVNMLSYSSYSDLNIPQYEDIIFSTYDNNNQPLEEKRREKFSVTVKSNSIVFYIDWLEAVEYTSGKFTRRGYIELDNINDNNTFNANETYNTGSFAQGYNGYGSAGVRGSETKDLYENLKPTSNSTLANGEQNTTPVEAATTQNKDTNKSSNTVEQKEVSHTGIDKIKRLSKAQVLTRLQQLSANNKHFSSVRGNKELTALIQRVAEIYNVPRVRTYVNKNNFVDGIYWGATRQAVKEIQEKLGDTYTDAVDGWAGTGTINAIIKKLG